MKFTVVIKSAPPVRLSAIRTSVSGSESGVQAVMLASGTYSSPRDLWAYNDKNMILSFPVLPQTITLGM